MNTEPESLQAIFDNAFAGISQARKLYTPHLAARDVGTIASVATGIAKVSGLPSVGYDELVKFPGGIFGIAFNVDANEIGVVLLGEYWHLHAGDEVQRTGRVMDVGVGDGLLGRVIDPLGAPSTAKGRWSLASVCRSNAQRHRSWTARPSPYHSRPASK